MRVARGERAGSGRKESGQWPLLAVGLFVVSYLFVGYLTLDETGRRVPMIAAGVTLILVVIEWLRSRFRPNHRDNGGQREGGGVQASESARREILAVAFVVGGVIGIYLLGFTVAIPLYLFSSIAYLGKQSLRTAIMVSAISSLVIYLVFELRIYSNYHLSVHTNPPSVVL